MVSVTEARQQAEQQRQSLARGRVVASQAETKLSEIRKKLPQITQKELRERFAGLKGKQRREVLARARKDISKREQQIKKYRKGLEEYEEKALKPFEKKIKQVEASQRAAAQYTSAVKVYLGIEKRQPGFENIPLDVRRKAQREAEQLEKTYTQRGVSEFQKFQLPEIPGLELSPQAMENLRRIYTGEPISPLGVSGIPEVTIGEDFYRRAMVGEPIDVSKLQLDIPEHLKLPPETMRQLGLQPITPEQLAGLDISKLPEMKISPEKEILKLGKEIILETLGVVGEVGKIPIAVPEPKLLPTGLPPQMRLSTVGAEAERLREALITTGEIAEKGWEEIIGKEKLARPVPTQIPRYEGETGIWTGKEFIPPREITIPEIEETTMLGAIPKIVRYAPEALAYTFAPVPTLTTDILTAGEKYKALDEDIKTETEKQYKEHLKEEIPEGYRHLTKEEFELEALPEIETKMREQLALEAGISMAFLGGIGAFKAFKTLAKPIITTRIPRPVQWVKEKAFVTPKGGRITTFDVYGYRAPVEARVTTPFREFVGMKPKIDWTPITKPQLEVFRPFAGTYVVGRAPYVAELGRVSKVPYGITTRAELEALAKIRPRGRLKVFEVTGKAEPITPEEILKLPKPEKYVWTGKPGIIVTEKGERLSQALIDTYRYFGRPGRRTQMFYTGMRVKPKIRIGDIKVFETRMGFKEVTKPYYRAAGRVPELRGTLVEIPLKEPPPLWTFDLTKTKFAAPPKFPGPTLQAPPARPFQYLEQLPKTKPVIPIVKPPKIRVPKIEEVKPMLGEGLPTMVGGLGLKEIPFAGMGLYERVEAISLPEVKVEPVLRPALVEVAIPAIREKIKAIPKVKVVPKIKERIEVIPKLKVVPRIREKIKVVPRVKVKVKVVPKVALKPKVVPRPTTKPRPKLRPPRPKLKPIFDLEKERKKRRELLRKRKKELVIPFVRRYREWIKVGKLMPKKRAIKKGVAELRRTLAASLQLRRPSGEVIPFAKPITKEFRLGKKGPEILVQRAPRRLKAPTEVQEIIAARKAGRIKF